MKLPFVVDVDIVGAISASLALIFADCREGCEDGPTSSPVTSACCCAATPTPDEFDRLFEDVGTVGVCWVDGGGE